MNPSSVSPGQIFPYLFEDLPVWPVSSARLAELASLAWPAFTMGKGLRAAAEETLQAYCKVKEPGNPTLLFKKGGTGPGEVKVDVSPFNIGRKKDCQIIIGEGGVSSLHAQIVREEESWVIQDMGSVNGTSLNGKWLDKKTSYSLKNGDVIGVMETELLVKMTEPVTRDPNIQMRFVSLQESGLLPPSAKLTRAQIGVSGGSLTTDLLVPTSLIRDWLETFSGFHYAIDSMETPLSDVEMGLYEFLLLKFLGFLNRSLPSPGPGQFFLLGLESPAPAVTSGEGRIEARFLCGFEKKEGDIRVVLDNSLISEAIAKTPPAAWAGTPSGIQSFLMEPWKWVTTPVAVRVGAVDLTPKELLTIEPGDVVLLPPDSPKQNDEGVLEGEVTLQFQGKGIVGGKAALQIENQRYQLQFKKFQLIPRPEANMDQKGTSTTPAGQPAEGGAEMVGDVMKDIQLSLVVELDRLQLTMEDLVGLVPGRVLPLHRLVTEPVSLSVEGRIIGKGQLVKINTELGVKVLSLKKQEME